VSNIDLEGFRMAMKVISLINIQIYETAFILHVSHIYMRAKLLIRRASEYIS